MNPIKIYKVNRAASCCECGAIYPHNQPEKFFKGKCVPVIYALPVNYTANHFCPACLKEFAEKLNEAIDKLDI